MKKIISFFIIIAGISMLIELWPLPPQIAKIYRENAAVQLAAPASSESSAAFQQSERDFYKSIIDNSDLELMFWFRWLVQFALIVCCIGAGTLMLLQARFWALSIIILTVFYGIYTGFFWPLYKILLAGTHSVDEIISRSFIVFKSLKLGLILLWFNIIVPAMLFLASFLALKSFRETQLNSINK